MPRAAALCRLGYLPSVQSYKLFCPEATTEIGAAAHSSVQSGVQSGVQSDHRTPVVGLYVSGAGTSPTGGVAGTPGRGAARALLADRA